MRFTLQASLLGSNESGLRLKRRQDRYYGLVAYSQKYLLKIRRLHTVVIILYCTTSVSIVYSSGHITRLSHIVRYPTKSDCLPE